MASFNETQNLSNVEQKKEYHKLLDKLSQLNTDSVDNKKRIDETMQILDEAKSLATASAANSNTSVVLLDSYLLRQAGQQALHAACNIEANTNVYNASELAQHIRENPAFWQFVLPRQVASAALLHGAFEPAPPPQRARAPPRRRTETQRNAALSKPDKIATLEKPQEDTVMVTRVRRVIKQAYEQGPVSYFHCVLDPGSFARSIENIYYVSFLVREGKVAVYVDEQHGIPMVRPVARAQDADRDISRENQFIVSINTASWKTLIEAFDIKKPMISDQ